MVIDNIKDYEAHFNPRTPYGMRLDRHIRQPIKVIISIHAPLTGCDLIQLEHCLLLQHFNPRTPYGMRLKYLISGLLDFNISIHAPLTGCD